MEEAITLLCYGAVLGAVAFGLRTLFSRLKAIEELLREVRDLLKQR